MPVHARVVDPWKLTGIDAAEGSSTAHIWHVPGLMAGRVGMRLSGMPDEDCRSVVRVLLGVSRGRVENGTYPVVPLRPRSTKLYCSSSVSHPPMAGVGLPLPLPRFALRIHLPALFCDRPPLAVECSPVDGTERPSLARVQMHRQPHREIAMLT